MCGSKDQPRPNISPTGTHVKHTSCPGLSCLTSARRGSPVGGPDQLSLAAETKANFLTLFETAHAESFHLQLYEGGRAEPTRTATLRVKPRVDYLTGELAQLHVLVALRLLAEAFAQHQNSPRLQSLRSSARRRLHWALAAKTETEKQKPASEISVGIRAHIGAGGVAVIGMWTEHELLLLDTHWLTASC